jgi:hypothetical protein
MPKPELTATQSQEANSIADLLKTGDATASYQLERDWGIIDNDLCCLSACSWECAGAEADKNARMTPYLTPAS